MTDKPKMFTQDECNKQITKALEAYRADQFTYSMAIGFTASLGAPHFSLTCTGGEPEALTLLANKIHDLVLKYSKKNPMKPAKEKGLVASSD